MVVTDTVTPRSVPFEVLCALLERPGDLVTREELRARLWPEGTFVDFDNNLNNAVTRLRQALGDSAENPQYIETLPRLGYRFLAPVAVEERREPDLPREAPRRAVLFIGAATVSPSRSRSLELGGVTSRLRLQHVRGCRRRPSADPLPQGNDLAEVICVVDRHAVQFVGHCHARRYLDRQPLRRLSHCCRNASTVPEPSTFVLKSWRRKRCSCSRRDDSRYLSSRNRESSRGRRLQIRIARRGFPFRCWS